MDGKPHPPRMKKDDSWSKRQASGMMGMVLMDRVCLGILVNKSKVLPGYDKIIFRHCDTITWHYLADMRVKIFP